MWLSWYASPGARMSVCSRGSASWPGCWKSTLPVMLQSEPRSQPVSVELASDVELHGWPLGPRFTVCPADVRRMPPKVELLSAPKSRFRPPAPARFTVSLMENCCAPVGRRTRSVSVLEDAV